MADHHAIDQRREPPEDRELFDVELRAGPFDFRKVVVRVHGRGRVAGKMFAATENPLPAQRIVEGARQPDDETGTDPVMCGGELALSIQGPSASAPAQRHHESTTIIWLAAWLGRSPSSRTAPG